MATRAGFAQDLSSASFIGTGSPDVRRAKLWDILQ